MTYMRIRPWNNARRMIVLEQLGSYISAGITLDRALEIVARSSVRHLRVDIDSIRTEVIAGTRLSSALRVHMDLSGSLVGLIEHGEVSGSLATALESARVSMERTSDMTKKCVSALIYPAVIACFSVLLILGLIRGVMPHITPMLISLHVPLPLLTRTMMSLTDIVLAYGIWIGCASLIIGIMMFVTYRRVELIRYIYQRVLLYVPIVSGGLLRYSYSMYLRSLGSLIDAGMNVPEAYDRTAMTVSLLPLGRTLRRCSALVHTGLSLSVVFERIRMPTYISSLVAAGESSGTLGRSLIRCADLIDRELDHLIKRLTSLIEPLMMVAMGGAVGSIALSIMMPIYDISKTLQQ